MTLELNGLEIDCVIGERPDERHRLQRLTVDLKLELPDDAARTDSLADTVDYAELGERVRRALVAAECRMIERAAYLAAECAMRNARVRACTARVEKCGAVAGLRSAVAEMTLKR